MSIFTDLNKIQTDVAEIKNGQAETLALLAVLEDMRIVQAKIDASLISAIGYLKEISEALKPPPDPPDSPLTCPPRSRPVPSAV